MGFLGSAMIVCFLAVFIVAIYLFHLNKRLSLINKTMDVQIENLQHELDMVSSAAIGVGQRLINVEKKLNRSIEKQQQLEMKSTDDLSLSQAQVLADKGADIDQLIDSCGLPEAEASLLALLKKKSEEC